MHAFLVIVPAKNRTADPVTQLNLCTGRIVPEIHVLGLINQGSNVGVVFGPAALGSLVQHFGWGRAWMLFAAMALCGIAAALGLKTVLGKVAWPGSRAVGARLVVRLIRFGDSVDAVLIELANTG